MKKRRKKKLVSDSGKCTDTDSDLELLEPKTNKAELSVELDSRLDDFLLKKFLDLKSSTDVESSEQESENESNKKKKEKEKDMKNIPKKQVLLSFIVDSDRNLKKILTPASQGRNTLSVCSFASTFVAISV